MNKATIIAITGASASGKSLFTQTIFDELLVELGSDGISMIKEDAYYKPQDKLSTDERERTNYDHPDAFDHSLLCSQIDEFIAGRSIDTPIYCYETHTRESQTKVVKPTKILLVEGILLLTNKSLRNKFDIKVYMDTPIDICLVRRIQRDKIERGRSVDSIIKQYIDSVRPMYYQFIAPTKELADITVTKGGQNRAAIELLKAKVRELVTSNNRIK